MTQCNYTYYMNNHFFFFYFFSGPACPKQTYKSSSGNEECIACGQNAKDGEAPRTTCACMDGFYKKVSQRNNVAADCFRKQKPLIQKKHTGRAYKNFFIAIYIIDIHCIINSIEFLVSENPVKFLNYSCINIPTPKLYFF